MNLDDAVFSAGHIAELARTEILNVHTWTTRGFADPYHTKPRVRRGRGRVRSYSMRDALRFFLMARLHEQYRIPLPRGLEIAQLVFGAENFDPSQAAYCVLEQNTSQAIHLHWVPDSNAVGRRLALEPLGTVINVKYVFDHICDKARQLRKEGT